MQVGIRIHIVVRMMVRISRWLTKLVEDVTRGTTTIEARNSYQSRVSRMVWCTDRVTTAPSKVVEGRIVAGGKTGARDVGNRVRANGERVEESEISY